MSAVPGRGAAMDPQVQAGDPATSDPRTEPPLLPSGARPQGTGAQAQGKGMVALRQAGLAALMTFVLTFPLVGLQTVDINGGSGLGINLRLDWVLIITAIVFALRLATAFSHVVPRPRFKMRTEAGAFVSRLSWPLGILGLVVAVAIPFLPFSDGYTINIATRILMYAVLGWGLNIVVGLAGLLDLGYVAFYAVGAYTVSILTSTYDFGFWTTLPLAGLLAALFGILLGFPVLRLRGDYLAIVTLGFGEIIRIVILNLGDLTGGPNGISSIPAPTFFGYPFARNAPEGVTTFHQLFGFDYDPLTRPTFIYFCVLVLAVLINAFSLRIRKLPIGRAWEALREDEIACRALGINPTNVKLSAFALGAMIGGLAGAFFPAANQNFVSPESFTFAESAAILAIVVLGGMGSQLGVVLAAILLNVLQELRQFAEFRMLIFGAAMVVIMVWRPRGLLAFRMPSIRLHGGRSAKGPPVPAKT